MLNNIFIRVIACITLISSPRKICDLCLISVFIAFGWMPNVAAASIPDVVVPIVGLAPPLQFRMTDATTGRLATASDFRGKIVLLYFGYTNCPDVCPDTLYKIHQIFLKLKKKTPAIAAKTIFLFVTVDPKRDKVALLNHYLSLFDPHFLGLRGSANALFRLTRRYRVVASVHPSANPEKYQVVHSALVYVFGPRGNARFIIPDLGLNPNPDYAALIRSIQQLSQSKSRRSVLTALARFN